MSDPLASIVLQPLAWHKRYGRSEPLSNWKWGNEKKKEFKRNGIKNIGSVVWNQGMSKCFIKLLMDKNYLPWTWCSFTSAAISKSFWSMVPLLFVSVSLKNTKKKERCQYGINMFQHGNEHWLPYQSDF